MNNPLEKKESRADFTYVPRVRDLKDAMYIPDDLDMLDRILANCETKPLEESKQSRKTAKIL